MQKSIAPCEEDGWLLMHQYLLCLPLKLLEGVDNG